MSALDVTHGGGDYAERIRLAEECDRLTDEISRLNEELRLYRAFVAAWDIDMADSTDAKRRAVRRIRQQIGKVDSEAVNAARLMVESCK